MKTATSSYDRLNKNRERNIAVAFRGKTATTALFFPSKESLDVQKALETGVIDKDTFILAIEKYPHKVKLIEDRFKELGIKKTNYYIHPGQAFSFFNLKEVLAGRKIDFMFYDPCGNYTGKIAYWFNQYQDCIADNTRIFFTFATAYRGCKGNKKQPTFPSQIDRFTKQTSETIVKQYQSLINLEIPNDISSCHVDSLRQIKMGLYFAFSGKQIQFNENLHLYKDTQTVMSLLDMTVIGNKSKDKTFDELREVFNKKSSLANQMIIPYTSERKCRKTRKHKAIAKLSYAKKLGIFNRQDLKNALKSAGKKAWIRKYANETKHKSFNRIVAGINRELTCIERKGA